MNHAFRKRIATLVLALSCGGCSSFNGRPAPVIPVQKPVGEAQKYDYSTALGEWDKAATGTEKQKIRDKFITLQIDAADARYVEFLTRLSIETKGSNFGLDLVALGLAGGGAVAGQGTANALSAAAAGITGTRASFNKDIFFEKTIPAVIAEMARSRTLALANLRAGLKQSYTDYPLSIALIDVNSYRNSTSLDDGIQQIVKNAVDQSNQAAEAFNAQFGACLPDKSAFVPRYKLRVFLEGLVTSDPRNDLDSMMSSLKIDTTGVKNAADKKDRILDYASQKLCSADVIKSTFVQWDKADFQ